MAVFKFKLQSVLDQRRVQEDAAQRELAVLLRQQMILQTQVRHMQEMMDEQRTALAGRLVGTLDMAHVRNHAAHHGRLAERLQHYIARLQELHPKIEAARQRLLSATRGRKALELLCDKQHEQWRQHQHRREILDSDEVALHIHARGG